MKCRLTFLPNTETGKSSEKHIRCKKRLWLRSSHAVIAGLLYTPHFHRPGVFSLSCFLKGRAEPRPVAITDREHAELMPYLIRICQVKNKKEMLLCYYTQKDVDEVYYDM